MVHNALPSTKCEGLIVKLDRICQNPPTDINALIRHLRFVTTTYSALPSTFSDSILISIARDIRRLQDCAEDDETTSMYLVAPMMLVSSLHMSVAKMSTAVLLSEDAFYESLHVYQWAIEREIIRRIAESSPCDDTETLIEKFECIRISQD
jgi:hypothetical protein